MGLQGDPELSTRGQLAPRAQRASSMTSEGLLRRRLEAMAGEQGDPRAHLHIDHHPQSPPI